jgi:hypothetical protein
MTPDDLDHTPLTFGKHRDKTPDEISEIDPGYIVWLAENVKPPVVSDLLAQACADDDDPTYVEEPWARKDD